MNVSYYLDAPDSYRRALPETVRQLVNGCGTAGWKGAIVPDTILRLDVTESCNIHDWCYVEGSTQADKERADDLFLRNMEATIEHAAERSWFSRILKPHRMVRAHEYYLAVCVAGHSAFWHDKLLPTAA